MKISKAVAILPMIFVISANVVGCNKNISTTVNNTVENMDISSSFTLDSVENIMECIDARILWIKEHSDGFTCIEEDIYKDCYDGNNLICRSFYQVLDSKSLSYSADANEYTLYYDEYENLIYADITHYRGPLYSIYIQDNELLHVEVGPFSYEGGVFVNGNIADVENAIKEDASFNFILEDFTICLENAH